jgi:hypothetical protein
MLARILDQRGRHLVRYGTILQQHHLSLGRCETSKSTDGVSNSCQHSETIQYKRQTRRTTYNGTSVHIEFASQQVEEEGGVIALAVSGSSSVEFVRHLAKDRREVVFLVERQSATFGSGLQVDAQRRHAQHSLVHMHEVLRQATGLRVLHDHTAGLLIGLDLFGWL